MVKRERDSAVGLEPMVERDRSQHMQSVKSCGRHTQQSMVGFREYATERTVDPLRIFFEYRLKHQTIVEDSSISL